MSQQCSNRSNYRGNNVEIVAKNKAVNAPRLLHTMSRHLKAPPTQNVQRALVVGDDDVRPLRLQMLPTAHVKPETQQVFHVVHQDADNPGEGERRALL